MSAQHKSLKLKTAPATQVISTADMKTYLQVDDAVEDTEITEAIIASRLAVEAWLGRSLINTVWNYWLDGWPRDKKRENPPEGVYNLPIDHFDQQKTYIDLPMSPLVSVASITYYNTADTGAVFAATNYLVDIISDPGRVILNSSASWPSTLLRPGNGVDIEFTSGYGTATTDVPEAILLAVKQMTKFNYKVMVGAYEGGSETPAFESDKRDSGLTEFVEKLLRPYRVVRAFG